MSPPYRVERETMYPGQEVSTFRVIIHLGNRWGTVQTGLDRIAADELCARLLLNEQAKQFSRMLFSGYRRR